MASEQDPLLDKDAEGGLLNKIVLAKQFSKWPSSTLIVARCTKVLVWGMVMLAVVGLVSSYLKGKIAVSSSTTGFDALMLPQVVLCPVWGEQAKNYIKIKSATFGNMATTDFPAWKTMSTQAGECQPFTYYKFDEQFAAAAKPRLAKIKELDAVNTMGCVCVTTDHKLSIHDTGKDYVRLAFVADSKIDTERPLAIGFSAGNNEYPASWSYIKTKNRAIGDITLEEFDYGSTPVSDGTVISQYTFETKTSFPLPPAQQIPGTDSELVLSFASYLITTTSDVNNIWSIHAMIYFLGLLLAVLAAISTFSLCFPEEVDPENPKPLGPSWMLQAVFGRCFSCCRKREDV